MLQKLTIVALFFVALILVPCISFSSLALCDSPQKQKKSKPAKTTKLSAEDQAALELGRRVMAVKKAIQNPKSENAMKDVKALGNDSRYYVMVSGWLQYQLRADNSILEANKKKTSITIKQRIEFLKKAIRALDLE